MSKRQFKSQASSGRAGSTSGAFGTSAFSTSQSSVLSYVQEPLDYSKINGPNIVVAFKNLSKKDATTKAKALGDLSSYVTSSDVEIDEEFLQAWTKLFPRLSVDNSRQVRQSTHVLNGHICAKSGRRVAKHMPRIAGPWLGATFDSDRGVARSASDALNKVFPTEEKIRGLHETFQKPILEYCRDAALHETVKSLSDERVENTDDAEDKYARVVATAISTIGSLLQEVDWAITTDEDELYGEILGDPKLWEFVHYADANVRRALHRMVLACFDKRSILIGDNLDLISAAYIYRGLHLDQAGCVLDFLQALYRLTRVFPVIWTDAYNGKRSPISRLRHFLKKGSQSAPNDFWVSMNNLFEELPTEVWPTTTEEIADLLSAARHGVSRREERFNASVAWPTYFNLAHIATSAQSDADAEKMLDTHLMPVVQQYLYPSPQTADWNIAGARAAKVISEITIARRVIPLLISQWPVLTEKLIETTKLSLPEQSEDFEKSQLHVAASGERWADLQRELWETQPEDALVEAFTTASNAVLTACVDLLQSRNGRPYGAAAILEQLLRTNAKHLLQNQAFHDGYILFAKKDIPRLMFSPSQRHLVHALYAISSDSEFSNAFKSMLTGILDAEESEEAKSSALLTVFTRTMPTEAVQIAKDMPKFQEFLVAVCSSPASGPSKDLFVSVANLGAGSTQTVDAILATLTNSLTTSDQVGTALSALDEFSKTNKGVIGAFLSQSGGAGEKLLPTVLRLEQSPDDEIAERAVALSSLLSSTMGDTTSDAKFNVVLQNLERTSESSLPIDAVLELANRLIGSDGKIEVASDLLPPFEIWLAALKTAIRPLYPSLALLSPLGGALHLLAPNPHSSCPQLDAEGFSQALRISMYVTRLLVDTNLGQQLGDLRARVFALLHLTILVAEDNVSIAGSNRLWTVESGREGEAAVIDFISDAKSVLAGYWKTVVPDLDPSSSTEFSQLFQALEQLREGVDPLSALSYYISLSCSETYSNLFELHGFSTAQVQASEAELKERRSAKQALGIVECISGFRQPLSGTPTLTRFCNELVANLTDLDVVANPGQALEQLVFLNVILNTQEEAVSGIAKQRIIFLVKRLIPWLGAEIPAALRVEACKALAKLLPGMHDMYGEHWEQVVDFLISSWGSVHVGLHDKSILTVNATLRLYSVLEKISHLEESNDDLLDVLKGKEDQLRQSLIHVLRFADGIDDNANQPLLITNELLARLIASLPQKPLSNAEELYPLLYTPSRPVQQAAFDLLHKHIPVAQEDISVNAALDDKTVHLPDELLSLILEPPTLDSLADEPFDRMMPLSLQGYLNSWRLVFDHFEGSSFKVKNDYIEQIKEGGYLTGLLDFTFDFLGHTRGKPVDVSKFDIQAYVPNTEEDPEKDVQWLLTHLYFLALTQLSNMARSYYLSIRSRQTSLSIESWTAKYISPAIITAALQGVVEWAETTVKDDPEYEKMTVKVGMKTKEITVSYVVDEQTMSIKVILPDAYTLASAQVIGVNRVAVKEEKWQSWLRNCAGVITFSNGSIIDGLTAWRKNVTGAIKGHTECAICYSIICSQKELPTKRCPVCKNMFHSSCLFKWFRMGGQSTCPLCRNTFSFGAAHDRDRGNNLQ